MKKIAIIGAGPAGIEAASILAKNGNEVQLFEKSSNTLSNILDKAYLFPDFSSAQDLADKLNAKLLNDKINLTCNTEIVDVKKEGEEFKLVDKDGKTYIADSVLITTGYTLFDAHRKEELGYGIYKGVITSLDLERMIRHQQISTFIKRRIIHPVGTWLKEPPPVRVIVRGKSHKSTHHILVGGNDATGNTVDVI